MSATLPPAISHEIRAILLRQDSPRESSYAQIKRCLGWTMMRTNVKVCCPVSSCHTRPKGKCDMLDHLNQHLRHYVAHCSVCDHHFLCKRNFKKHRCGMTSLQKTNKTINKPTNQQLCSFLFFPRSFLILSLVLFSVVQPALSLSPSPLPHQSAHKSARNSPRKRNRSSTSPTPPACLPTPFDATLWDECPSSESVDELPHYSCDEPLFELPQDKGECQFPSHSHLDPLNLTELFPGSEVEDWTWMLYQPLFMIPLDYHL